MKEFFAKHLGVDTGGASVEAIDPEDADYVAAMRVADAEDPETMRTPALRRYARTVRDRSEVVPCCECGADCYRDIHSPKRPPLICVPCLNRKMEEDSDEG